jgi:hypothetical protein
MGMLVECMLLFMVGLDQKASSIPLFSHIVHSSECNTLVWCPSAFELIEGDFPCPRVLAAWEIGANEVVSLLVWIRPLSWVDDCVCWCYLLLLLLCMYTIYCASISLYLAITFSLHYFSFYLFLYLLFFNFIYYIIFFIIIIFSIIIIIIIIIIFIIIIVVVIIIFFLL